MKWSQVGNRAELARNQFNHFATLISEPDFVFMNYGFLPANTRKKPRLSARQQLENSSIRLLNQVLAGARVKGRKVLEIGCGRGGNCRELRTRLEARQVTGLDLAEKNVAFCTQTFGAVGRFLRGSALDLPLSARAFDLVLNLESSGWYSDFPRFLAECRRVLKPGGILAYADLLRFWVVDQRESEFRKAGFRILRSRDLSNGVQRAIEQNAKSYAHYLGKFGARNPMIRGFIRSWNEVALGFADNLYVYPSWLLRKE